MKINFPRQTGITKQTFALLHRPEKLAWLNAQAPKGQVNLIKHAAGRFDGNQPQQSGKMEARAALILIRSSLSFYHNHVFCLVGISLIQGPLDSSRGHSSSCRAHPLQPQVLCQLKSPAPLARISSQGSHIRSKRLPCGSAMAARGRGWFLTGSLLAQIWMSTLTSAAETISSVTHTRSPKPLCQTRSQDTTS